MQKYFFWEHWHPLWSRDIYMHPFNSPFTSFAKSGWAWTKPMYASTSGMKIMKVEFRMNITWTICLCGFFQYSTKPLFNPLSMCGNWPSSLVFLSPLSLCEVCSLVNWKVGNGNKRWWKLEGFVTNLGFFLIFVKILVWVTLCSWRWFCRGCGMIYFDNAGREGTGPGADDMDPVVIKVRE